MSISKFFAQLGLAVSTFAAASGAVQAQVEAPSEPATSAASNTATGPGLNLKDKSWLDDSRLVFAATSLHHKFFEKKDQTPANQTNPGIGLNFPTDMTVLGGPVRGEVGFYRNSNTTRGDHFTSYAVAEILPYQVAVAGDVTAKFGAVAGIATGYTTNTPQLAVGPFVPMLALRTKIGTDTTSLVATTVVNPGKSITAAVGFEMKF
jgi:hypothetical protein